MKNLLLIHMESINYFNYMLNFSRFKNVYSLQKESVIYDKYYSTATSTEMAIADIMYSDYLQYEKIKSLSDIPSKYHTKNSVLDILEKNGLSVNVRLYPRSYGVYNGYKRRLFGKIKPQIIEEYGDLLKDFSNIIKNDNFAYYVCNFISHIDEIVKEKLDFKNDNSVMEEGAELLDNMVGDLIRILKESSKLESTIIVIYGDHGDDYWTHGYHMGLTHAIEPYMSLIHTPLIIYNSKKNVGRVQNLVSSIDIKNIIISELNGDNYNERREYVVSRNAYAAQPIRKDSYNKGYSITDGTYLLIVTSEGLEMYETEMDMDCHNNLLKYTMYDQNGYLSFGGLERFNHMKSYFCERTERQIRQKFYYLKTHLMRDVAELYTYAGRSEQDMLNELCFDKIKDYISRIW